MNKKNREQRRQDKFGGGRSSDSGGWPSSEPTPAFGGSGDPTDATAGRPDQGQTDMTGPGTGGATEQDGRRPKHEGTHGGNSTKG